MGDSAMGATQYVAFLRAVNVGGRIVKMTELKKIFEAAGVDDVRTFIASGNVIFSSAKPAARLEPHIEIGLHKALGYGVTTMVRTVAEVAAVGDYQAFPPRVVADASLYVGFMQTQPSPAAQQKTLSLQTDIDELRVHGREIYWLARKNISESTISMAKMEKTLQTPVTFRNINTIRRLAEKFKSS
jgi:uncharacterized protein (DUF1697 family)